MAGDPLSLRVKVDPGALLLAERVSEAARAAKAELRELDRKVDESIAKGQEVDAKTRDRIAYLEGVQRQAGQARQAAQDAGAAARQLKDLKQDADLLKKLAGLQILKNVATGNFGATDVAQLLATPATRKALERVGLSQIAGAVTRYAPLAAFAKEGAEFAIGKIEEHYKNKKAYNEGLAAALDASAASGLDPTFAKALRMGALSSGGQDAETAKRMIRRIRIAAAGKQLGFSEMDTDPARLINDPEVIRRANQAAHKGSWREVLNTGLNSSLGSFTNFQFFETEADYTTRAQMAEQVLEERFKAESQRRADREKAKTTTERFKEFEQQDMLERQWQQREDRMGGTSDLRTARFED